MDDSSLFVIVLLVFSIGCGSIGYVVGFEIASNCIKSTESVVENKGFNVGDTLIIIKK